MSIILTYNENGGQKEGPKRQDALKLLMSYVRALKTPKKKEMAGKIVKWLHFVYIIFIRNQWKTLVLKFLIWFFKFTLKNCWYFSSTHVLKSYFLNTENLLNGKTGRTQAITNKQFNKSKKLYDFLSFPKLRKSNTDSFLTFFELQPLVSYKRLSYKKKYMYFLRLGKLLQ